MATAYRVNTALLLVKDRQGLVRYHYHPGSGLGGSVIPWLPEEQAELFLAQGWVTPIEIQTEAEAETQDMLTRVTECLEALASTDLPADCGAPKAREVLRDSGRKFSNEVIAAAVKARKAALSGTSSS
jgi:cytochrome c oxidase cbb3-type subunit II